MKFYQFLLLILLSASFMKAQAPNKFSYQAVVRNQGNALVINRQVGLRFTILQGSATGFGVYAETHRTMTNLNGLVSVEIGAGTPLFNSIANINWANGPYFLKTETDPNGGFSYTISGTTQMLSVPYALYAETSANPGNPGYTSIIKTEPIYPGTGTCRFGGTMITVGLDLNRNQILDTAEINRPLTRFICNGKDGKGIINTVDNGNGTFTFYYNDGTSFTTSDLTGPQGPIGLTGPQGTTGATGPQGATGLTGPQGATGPQGPIGLTGPQGTTGPQGPIGLTGPQGTTGPQGATGLTGPQGTTGATGPQGPIGLTGPQGATGPQGPIGLTSPQGPAGATGPQGPAGILVNGTQGQTLYHNGTTWVATSNLYNNGTNVAVGNSNPDNSAAFQVSSTAKGVLLPSMTLAQRNTIPSPATGLLIFQIDNTPGFYYYNGSAWVAIAGSGSGSSGSGSNPNTLIYTTDGF